MVRVNILPTNKRPDASSYPKLKLERDERARIVCIETDPVMEWTHTLRAPELTANGEPVYEQIKSKDGTIQTVLKYQFIGRPICLGDPDTVTDKGTDPDHCPVCKASVEHDFILPPERRFALHVVKYAVMPGSFNVANPFVAQLQAWTFSDFLFTKLADFAGEWGDLRMHDLTLGPCTNVNFQKFDINITPSAAWLANEQNKNFVKALYVEENKCQDLSMFCGRRADLVFLKMDLDKVITNTRVALGLEQAATFQVGGGDVSTQLNEMLAQEQAAAGVPASVDETSGGPFDETVESQKLVTASGDEINALLMATPMHPTEGEVTLLDLQAASQEMVETKLEEPVPVLAVDDLPTTPAPEPTEEAPKTNTLDFNALLDQLG